MPIPLIHPITLIKESWKTFTKTWETTIKYSSWMILASVLSSALLFLPEGNWILNIFAGILYLISIVLAVWIGISLYQVILAMENGKTISKETTKTAVSLILPLSVVALIGGVFTIGGFIAFILPGIYIGIRLGFAQLSLIEQPIKAKNIWVSFVVPHIVFIASLLLGNVYPTDWMRIVVQLGAFIYLGYAYYQLFKEFRAPLDASWTMTRDKFWAIFGRQALGGLCFGIIFLMATFIAVWIVSMISGVNIFEASGSNNASPAVVGADNIINGVIQAAFLPLVSIFQVKLYNSVKKSRS